MGIKRRFFVIFVYAFPRFRGEANEVLLSGKTKKPKAQSNKQTSATRKGKGAVGTNSNSVFNN